MRCVVIGATLLALAGAGRFSFRAWQDTHPRLPTKTYAMRDYSLTVPAHWPPPAEDMKSAGVENAADLQEGSLDQFRWYITLFDGGTKNSVEDVAKEMRSGYMTPPPEPVDVTLANGIVAKTWTSWDPLGELNQEHRRYVFKAPTATSIPSWSPCLRAGARRGATTTCSARSSAA